MRHDTCEDMDENNTLQQCSHRMCRGAANKGSKEQVICALGLGCFLLSKNPVSLQGQLIGKFIPTGLPYGNNREGDTFLEIPVLGRETIAIDFIC